MEIPKGLAHTTKKEVERQVRKTLVDKILIEDLAKELEAYLDGKVVSKRMRIEFEGWKDLSKDKYIKTRMKRKIKGMFAPKEAYEHVYVDLKESLSKAETEQILKDIINVNPNMREEEISISPEYGYYHLNVSSKDFIYKISVHFYKDGYTEMGGKRRKEEKDGGTVKIKGVSVPLTYVYHNPFLYGYIDYVKFNQKHHEKLLKVLTDRGYEWNIELK